MRAGSNKMRRERAAKFALALASWTHADCSECVVCLDGHTTRAVASGGHSALESRESASGIFVVEVSRRSQPIIVTQVTRKRPKHTQLF